MTKANILKIRELAKEGIDHLNTSGKKWEPLTCFKLILKILDNEEQEDDYEFYPSPNTRRSG